MAHDFLWRTHLLVPARGYLTAFNRSYYEEVLITRVHGEVWIKKLRSRMKHIVHFEKMLLSQYIQVLRSFYIFLPSSSLIKSNPDWKTPISDGSSTAVICKNAIIGTNMSMPMKICLHILLRQIFLGISFPANNRWFRNYFTLQILVSALEKLPLAYPHPAIIYRLRCKASCYNFVDNAFIA